MDLISQLAINVGLHNLIGWFLPIYVGVTNILPTLVVVYNYADKGRELENPRALPEPGAVYDFIVVGGGSGGSIVANRLSENFNVLLLERGGDPNPLTEIPQLDLSLMNFPEIVHTYKTVPQNNSCLSLNNKLALWTAGSSLGGSSVINSLVYLRGHPNDFDHWAKITGDKRWSFGQVLPFFFKSEDYCLKCDQHIANLGGTGTMPDYHAVGGPIGVRQASFGPLVPEFLTAMEWASIFRADLNAPFSHGCNVVTNTQRNGRRSSTLNGYLKPTRGRPTLKIVKYATVYKVLFRPGKLNEAFGVEYERFGEKHIAVATNEIILSAGAIETPKILMLSGIGPKDHLESLKIPVRVSAPVGLNMMDHIIATPGPFLINTTSSFLAERDLNQTAIDQFVYNGTGAYSVSSSSVAVALWPSLRAISTGEPFWPDLMMKMSGSGINQNSVQTITGIYNLDSNIANEFFGTSTGKDGFQLSVSFGRPRSRGYMRLASTNYKDDPLIDPRYLSDIEGMDVRVMVEAIKRAVYVAENAPSFRAIGSRLSPTPFPPCRMHEFRSDAYWECLIRHYTQPAFHFCGTTAMGPYGSPYSVVNSVLKVHNTLRLRVIDASVIPTIPSADINAAVMMIGERGAQFIKDAWEVPVPHPVSPLLPRPQLHRRRRRFRKLQSLLPF